MAYARVADRVRAAWLAKQQVSVASYTQAPSRQAAANMNMAWGQAMQAVPLMSRAQSMSADRKAAWQRKQSVSVASSTKLQAPGYTQVPDYYAAPPQWPVWQR